MNVRRQLLALGLGAASAGASPVAMSQGTPESKAAPAGTSLFAVEFRTGPAWDAARPTHEQAHFREHSANLRRLRETGTLLIGARYSDKGFLIVAAETEAGVRALIDVDPAIQSRVFVYDVHPFAVFYAGCVAAPKRGG